MTDDSNRDFSGAVNQSPGMNEREGVAQRLDDLLNSYLESPNRFGKDAFLDEIWDNKALIIAALRAPAPSAWQPIETAPKDGTFIHVWFPDNGDGPPSQCLTCSWKLLPESGLTKGAWFAQSGGRAFRMDGATHWMPINGPSLPSSDRGGVG
jgi:hypothetical protein